jgi:hypothetical protein
MGCSSVDDSAPGNVGIARASIIGGTPVAVGSVPWQAAIFEYGNFECGGSILSEDGQYDGHPVTSGSSHYILTAGHCASDGPSAFKVAVGKINVDQAAEPTEQDLNVAQVIVHPDFDANTVENDIALLKLASPVTFTSAAQPIMLPNARYQAPAIETVTGYGAESAGLLETVDLPIVDQATCGPVMVTPTQPLLPSMLCTSDPTVRKSTCYHDSGGPATVGNAAGIRQEIGIVSWGAAGCNEYEIQTNVIDYYSWIKSIVYGKRYSCQGMTPEWYTNWQDTSTADTIRLDVDTSQCAFTATPAYFTSIGGSSHHYMVEGSTSIYLATATGFTVYLYYPGITAALANQYGWQINWQGMPVNAKTYTSLCNGQTTPGSNWVQNDANSIYIDVDTSSCSDHINTPLYFTALTGLGQTWDTIGATSIYSPTPTGFRVYVKQNGITPAGASLNKWAINWAAAPSAAHTLDLCTGSSAPGAGWVQYGNGSVYLDVDTSRCGRTVTPLYLTSLGGSSSHYGATGATSIYKATPTGFRVYLTQSGLTAALATSRGYQINWASYP